MPYTMGMNHAAQTNHIGIYQINTYTYPDMHVRRDCVRVSVIRDDKLIAVCTERTLAEAMRGARTQVRYVRKELCRKPVGWRMR